MMFLSLTSSIILTEALKIGEGILCVCLPSYFHLLNIYLFILNISGGKGEIIKSYFIHKKGTNR